MTDAKNGQARQLFSDKMGQRHYTLASLREKIEDQFIAETNGRLDILGELDTRDKRLAALAEAADYVLAMEYVNLPAKEKRQIIEQAVANIFYFGTLDPYLRDPDITEITIEGVLKTEVRRGFGDLVAVEQPFENLAHLERILSTMLAPSGAVLSADYPFIEVGLNVHERRARLSLIAPPLSMMYSVQMRLHPQQAPSVKLPDGLLARLQSGRGLIVAGEVGTGKTTLLAALLNGLENPAGVLVVERAAEMSLPPAVTRLAVPPPRPDAENRDFSDLIAEATRGNAPRLLVLDEVRGDESAGFWGALGAEDAPAQMLIALRGSANPARLYSALTMAIRKSYPGIENAAINAAILHKLPDVLVLQRGGGRHSWGSWQAQGDGLTLGGLL